MKRNTTQTPVPFKKGVHRSNLIAGGNHMVNLPLIGMIDRSPPVPLCLLPQHALLSLWPSIDSSCPGHHLLNAHASNARANHTTSDIAIVTPATPLTHERAVVQEEIQSSICVGC